MSEDTHNNGMIEAIYDCYADMLFRISYSVLLSKEDAEDAVHDVFAKFIFSGRSFRDKEHEKAWFIRVTVNRSKDILRKKKIRSFVPLEEVAEIGTADKSDAGLLEEVLSLPEKYKTAILLHYFEGFNLIETADILNISESAAKMRVMRGREMLKNELERSEENG